MVTPVYLFPTEAEAAAFRSACPAADVRICGVGMAAAAATASHVVAEHPQAVVLTGIAGAVRGAGVKVGEVVQASAERVCGLPAVYACWYRPTLVATGVRAVKAVTVSLTGSGIGALIENMEGAAVLAVCEAHGVPCGEIRAISNLTDEPRCRWHVHEAVEALAQVLKNLTWEEPNIQ